MTKRALTRVVALLGVVAVCICGGCRTVDSETEDLETKPWNTPAGWEGQIMGVPY